MEKRRAIVRQKAEQERMAAELESRREAERLRKRNEGYMKCCYDYLSITPRAVFLKFFV